MESNISLPAQLILISHMNNELMELWNCEINTKKIIVMQESIKFQIKTPSILDYISNNEISLTDDVKVHTWICNDLHPLRKPIIKIVSPGDDVTFENLKPGNSSIEGCISYRNR